MKPPTSKRPPAPTASPKRPPGPTSSSEKRGSEAMEPAEVKPSTSQRPPEPTSSRVKRLRVIPQKEVKRDPDAAASHLLPLAPSQRRAAVNKLFDV